MAIYTNNRFSRTRENEAKMGAYYTDVAHCRDIAKMFQWPDEEVCILEPSIGDATAVIAVTDVNEYSNRKIFGVELNGTVAAQTKQNPYVETVLEADFTNGVRIRKHCFSFCFANPPYLTEHEEDGGVRVERVFLEKIINYLKFDGVLVWVVPYSQFMDKSHTRLWIRNFETLAMYRFRAQEYAKYHQIVVVGKHTRPHEVLAPQLEAYQEKYHLDNLEELPNNLEPTIVVPPSPLSGVDLFAARIFNSAEAYQYLASNGFSTELNAAIGRRLSTPKFSEGELLRPPIPPKKDSLYLLATSGAGQGIAGSEEAGDLHLQRGVAEVVETARVNECEDEDGERMQSNTMTVTSRTQITMTVVQNDGTITALA